MSKELADEPFHLIASFDQRGNKKVALEELYQNGLEVNQANVTGTIGFNHPNVSGITYVPYYLLFGPNGDLIHHHQGGPYHGGDGTSVLDRIKKLIKDGPRVYVGADAYNQKNKKLAKDIASGKNLRQNLMALKRALQMRRTDKELKRLKDWVDRRAEQQINRFQRVARTDIAAATKTLQKEVKIYDGTGFGKNLINFNKKNLANRRQAKKLADESKAFKKLVKSWNSLDSSKGNKGNVINPLRQSGGKKIDALKSALSKHIKNKGYSLTIEAAKTMLSHLES